MKFTLRRENATPNKPAPEYVGWYRFSQNNPGGRYDEEYGAYTFIHATSSEEANRIALNHGIYFEGVHYGRYCSCCGDRWSAAYGAPRFDSSSAEEVAIQVNNWIDNLEFRLHGLDIGIRLIDKDENVYWMKFEDKKK